MASKTIRTFRKLPKDLFRINNGPAIKLRDWSVNPTRTFDLKTEDGLVKPKALNPSTYVAPNGASMRPNSSMHRNILSRFRAINTIVYSVPAAECREFNKAVGTQLPEDLILVHEHLDHYSLQPTKDVALEELEETITEFLNRKGKMFTKSEWLSASIPKQQNRTRAVVDQVHPHVSLGFLILRSSEMERFPNYNT
ncbi:MAG: hypothetical protein M4579_004085 [Chaenotheca gracillima]|nr:MAG: hypothetical protein M4579_004085 [Chaenotheca gracillima]